MVRSAVSTAILLAVAGVAAQTTTPPPSTTTAAAASPTITAVSDCHPHGTVQWCMAGTEEYQVVGPTRTEEFESQYTDCHAHGADLYCMASDGDEVQVLVEAEETHTEEGHDHAEEEEEANATEGEQDCHFHAGVEHCVGAGESESGGTVNCERQDRDYNVRLRVGLLFVILVTSAIGVFLPILATSFTRITQNSIIFIILKQFGTGVVLSTAFIHLFTHAELMFKNECLGTLEYEGTTAAVFLAGLFLSFMVDYLCARFVLWRQSKKPGTDAEVSQTMCGESKASSPPDSVLAHQDHHGGHVHAQANMDAKVNVLVLEAGIIFHSLLIGLTLVVAGDSFFITLFIVILFHQMFEGIALGASIASIPKSAAGLIQKLLMGTAFAFITPIGMAIGIGTLDRFNGNDPSTLIALGTLNAFSAGILAWVGIVEMLARDWVQGPLLKANVIRTSLAMASLVSGMVLMSVLGKWA